MLPDQPRPLRGPGLLRETLRSPAHTGACGHEADATPGPPPRLRHTLRHVSHPRYILAGGRSRRFGSDKARALLRGRTLLQRVADAWPGALAVASEPAAYEDLGVPTLGDLEPHAGPLGGVLTALRHRLSTAGPGWAAVATCDWLDPQPLGLPPLTTGPLATVRRDPTGRLQPFPGWYHTDLAPHLAAALAENRRSICDLLERVPHEAPAGPAPLQANTPQAVDGLGPGRVPLRVLAARPRTTRTRHAGDIGYLRLSLTRGCSMRCTYCRPGFDRNPVGEQRLSPSQLRDLTAHLAATRGLTKVRLTGGDPTSRAELLEILGLIAGVPGVTDLAMTTNGLTLQRNAHRYAAAGLNRVNVSLDTLDPGRFRGMTGVPGPDRVLRGIDAALAAGLGVKLNTVVIRGQNDTDVPEMLSYAADHGVPLRLIELMPMGPIAADWHRRYAPESHMRAVLAPTVTSYTPLPQGRSAARSYRVGLADGRTAELGFITPMSCNFCEACDRLRLDAAGRVYPCLMDEPRGDLARVWPGGAFDPTAFDAALSAAYDQKSTEHPALGVATMTHIGG